MKEITEDYVSFEVAKLLKEKGFLKGVDLRTTQNLSFYDNIGLTHNLNKYYDTLIQDKIDFVVAPTHQMAMKWLREKHICIVIIPKLTNIESGCDYFAYIIWAGDNLEVDGEEEWDKLYSYEDAVEAAIKYSLENLI